MLKKIIPHVLIVISVVLITFFIIDQVNSAMGFINNQGTKIILCIYAFLVLGSSVYIAVKNHRE